MQRYDAWWTHRILDELEALPEGAHVSVEDLAGRTLTERNL